jgi:hypothetical protein
MKENMKKILSIFQLKHLKNISMKKVNLSLLTTMLLAIVACSKEEIMDEIPSTETQLIAY